MQSADVPRQGSYKIFYNFGVVASDGTREVYLCVLIYVIAVVMPSVVTYGGWGFNQSPIDGTNAYAGDDLNVRSNPGKAA